MTRDRLSIVLIMAVALWFVAGCDFFKGEQPPPPLPVPVAPVALPVATPPPVPQPVVPPPTMLTPITDASSQVPSESSGKRHGGGGGGGGAIDTAIKGTKSDGKELIGNYSCALDSKDIKLPFGMKLPPFGCKIFESDDGKLHVASISRGVASIKGDVTDPGVAGFFINGSFQAATQSFDIKARMLRKGTDTFSGKGRGTVNGDKTSAINYTLTMIKQ